MLGAGQREWPRPKTGVFLQKHVRTAYRIRLMVGRKKSDLDVQVQFLHATHQRELRILELQSANIRLADCDYIR